MRLESPTLFGDAISRCQPPKSFVLWQRVSRRNGWRWPRVATWNMTWGQVLLAMGMSGAGESKQSKLVPLETRCVWLSWTQQWMQTAYLNPEWVSMMRWNYALADPLISFRFLMVRANTQLPFLVLVLVSWGWKEQGDHFRRQYNLPWTWSQMPGLLSQQNVCPWLVES